MKVLIINKSINKTESHRSLGGLDTAITMGLYIKYRSALGISANHLYSKYTFIDEKNNYIGTFNTMDDLTKKIDFLGNVMIVTTEQWLDKNSKGWRKNPRNTYW